MLLLRGATFRLSIPPTLNAFQYMLLLRGATQRQRSLFTDNKVSIHAPLARSNRRRSGLLKQCTVSIHAPLARSNRVFRVPVKNCLVSIHAPLARSNCINLPLASLLKFQYMLLLRGATERPDDAIALIRFQYMLLLRGATETGKWPTGFERVSIHAPLARSNFLRTVFRRAVHHVSIHAPLARSNPTRRLSKDLTEEFQYMLLLRGATRRRRSCGRLSGFNTCSSCEEQQKTDI